MWQSVNDERVWATCTWKLLIRGSQLSRASGTVDDTSASPPVMFREADDTCRAGKSQGSSSPPEAPPASRLISSALH